MPKFVLISTRKFRLEEIHPNVKYLGKTHTSFVKSRI
jgi:hypothetical protein